jgi:hypothetical protein
MNRGEEFIFVRRQVGKGRIAECKIVTVETMKRHVSNFATSVLAAQRELGVSEKGFHD